MSKQNPNKVSLRLWDNQFIQAVVHKRRFGFSLVQFRVQYYDIDGRPTRSVNKIKWYPNFRII